MSHRYGANTDYFYSEQNQSLEAQQNFHTSPYQDFDESDDYSFAPDFSDYCDHEKLLVYYDKRLVWGTPP